MSDAQAIAAVTIALSNLLAAEAAVPLNGGNVTTRPLDKARDASSLTNQLNLFLYAVTIDAALRNQDLPWRLRPGETGQPPVPLTLHYLLTAYGQDDDTLNPSSHALLGFAMRAFHDHPLITHQDLSAAAPTSDVSQQVEGVRITPEALSIDDMSKLWTTFQTQYRVSTAYRVSVVLIDSGLGVRAPLPVLQRGTSDRGWDAANAATSPLPTLVEARLAPGAFAAAVGTTVNLVGTSLNGSGHVVVFTHTRLGAAPQLAPASTPTATSIPVTLAASQPFSAGLYTVQARLTRPGETTARTTNQFPLMVVPTVTITPLTAAAGTVALTVNVVPAVQQGQQVSLLFGDREIPIAVSGASSVLNVSIPSVTAGTYVVRVRVDGADSIPYATSGTSPVPRFSPSQTVTVS